MNRKSKFVRTLLNVAVGGLAAAVIGGQPVLAEAPVAAKSNPGLQAVDMDLAPLDRIVGDHPVVVFGEDSHGMTAEHSFVRQAFERLVERKHFRVFVFEAQWGLHDAFQDFMASDRTTFSPVEQFFLDGAFVSDDTLKMMIWIRAWNRAHPHDPVLVTGFQPEQPVTDMHALLGFLHDAAPKDLPALAKALEPCRAGGAEYATDLDFINDTFKRRKAKEWTFSSVDRAACLVALDSARQYLDDHRAALTRATSPARVELAVLHDMSMRTYVDTLSRLGDEVGNVHDDLQHQLAWSGVAYGGGDLSRYQIFNGLRAQFYGDSKIFFWMHDWHAARHASETGPITPGGDGIPKGTISVGERLAAEFGDKAVTIGSIVPCNDRCKEPADSLEPAFTAKFGDRPALIDLHDPVRTQGLPVDKVGSVFANHHGFGFGDVVLKRQYDAILYLPSSAVVR